MTLRVPSPFALALLASVALAACSSSGNEFCGGEERCEFSCPDGYCNFYCDDRASCVGACEGGECTLTCTGAAQCTFTCPPGDCAIFCRGESTCAVDCEGCRVDCAPGTTCTGG